MTRYKPTEFPDDDTCSISGIQLNDAHSTATMQICYHTARASMKWRARQKMEKWLWLATGILTLIIVILSLVILAHSDGSSQHRESKKLTATPANTMPCLQKECVFAAADILSSMDQTIDPCKDFYAYACDGWVKSNPIPEGKSTWGTFSKLEQENQLIIRNVLDQPVSEFTSKAEIKAKIYYESCLDKDDHMEKLGAKPLIDILKEIGGWNVTQSGFNLDKWDLAKLLMLLHNKYNFNCLFGWAIGEDDKNSTRYIIQIDQGGITLPTPDYYNNRTEIHRKVLSGYVDYMTKVAVLLGATEDDARRQMQSVIDFEAKLANISVPLDERRDEEAMYHLMTLEELQNMAPFLNWTNHFNDALHLVNKSLTSQEPVVVYAPDFIRNLSVIIFDMMKTKEGNVTIANYMVWHAVRALTPCLSKQFRDAYKIVRRVLMGSDGGEEIWRYCIADTNNALGFAVGAIFVRAAFHGAAKPEAEQMIDEILTAFKSNLRSLNWINESTRQVALEKADAISNMIGFPDYILHAKQLDEKYVDLTIKPNLYFANNLAVNAYNLRRNLEKFGQPVNKTIWGMTPQMVNAYYTPTKNQIVFPAGILQSPFYNTHHPRSLNYGAMGVVMGHELTHAFDDQGREYDKYGNINHWWDNTSIKYFTQKAECFAAQYNQFKLTGTNVNGKQTLGENIADNGGLKAAYHAFMKSPNIRDVDKLPLPGLNLTHQQLFFLSFAQVWCSSTTDETSMLQLEKDSHSPPQFRVLGTLANMREFAQAYNCPANTQMNPTHKCEVW